MSKTRNRTRAFGALSTPAPTLLLGVSRTYLSREALAGLPVFDGLYAIDHIFTTEEAAAREARRQEKSARRN